MNKWAELDLAGQTLTLSQAWIKSTLDFESVDVANLIQVGVACLRP